MTTGELLIAFFLLSTPPGNPEPSPSEADWPALQKALVETAREWEILDERETKYILAKRDEFGVDVNLLRRRHQDLKDVPKVADAQRFPDRGTVNESIKFNRAFRQTLDNRQLLETDRASEFRTIISETDRLYTVWDAVRDSRCEFYNVTVRRQALKKLREMVGEEAYTAGDLPPVVPVWRFVAAR